MKLWDYKLERSGKTTMMRMLCGYLMPDKGEIEVAGINLYEAPLEVKRKIGYLPENCPLYSDMRVDEYLKYRACLKGVSSRQLKERLSCVKEQCALENVGRRIIGQLSKGYRQRVGLADALIHEPSVLILDEPTVGLDPHQIRQVRRLIRSLSEHHTIMLSTHIMQEVEAICERVMVIREGSLIATEPVHTSDAAEKRHIMLVVDAAIEKVDEKIDLAEGVKRHASEQIGAKSTQVEVELLDGFSRADLFDWVVAQGWRLQEMYSRQPTLEDRFVNWVNRKEPCL